MSGMVPVYESHISSLPLLNRGKVRDIYALDRDNLLFVASDRISAFDVILPDPVPGKGMLLTALSGFWFAKTSQIIGNHLIDRSVETLDLPEDEYRQVRDRAVIVRKLSPLPVEAVVRGYLAGSGWKDYLASGAVCGISLPAGLKQAEQLPGPVFTPATKAAVGEHDENISFAEVCNLVGDELAGRIRDISTSIYKMAVAYARERGIIIADTKFEFGLDDDGRLFLIDEVLTPDSSRFWPVTDYRTGISPPSFDKQYVRDYLETLDWDKRSPGPPLPAGVIRNTQAKYREAHDRLAGPGNP